MRMKKWKNPQLKASVEEESTDAKATYTTPRYEKAYEIPEKQLEEKWTSPSFH